VRFDHPLDALRCASAIPSQAKRISQHTVRQAHSITSLRDFLDGYVLSSTTRRLPAPSRRVEAGNEVDK